MRSVRLSTHPGRDRFYWLEIFSREQERYAGAFGPYFIRSDGTQVFENGSLENKLCGQANVINLFLESDKRAKKIPAMHADRKGNFVRERSHDARAKFHSVSAIAHSSSRSQRA
jgi:hypothetical protein